MSWQNKIIGITPFICVIAFVLIGYYVRRWDLAWLVFLLIPLMPVLVGKKQLRFSFPLVITMVYIGLGIGFGWWHPGWVLFLLIPIVEILKKPSDRIFRVNIKDQNND
jgi:hypothetical protein